MKQWSTIKKLMWLFAKLKGGAQAIIETITGTLPLVLQNALSHDIVSLTRYGLCTQDGTPTPNAPVDIKCNNGALKWDSVNQRVYADGTPEVLTVSGNIVEFNETRIDNTTWAAADKSHGFEVRADVYNKHVGNSLFSNANAYGAFVPCKLGQSISINFFDYAPYYGRCYYCEVTADGKCNTEPVKYSSNTALTQQTFTLTQADSIGFVIEWYISAEERNYTKENYAVCYGTTPLAAYQPYTPIQTVTDLPMLLSVGDYKDEEEIINGIKTGKVGIYVFTGEEAFTKGTAFYTTNTSFLPSKAGNITPMCTHFKGISSYASRVGDSLTMTVNGPYTGSYRGCVYFYADRSLFATAADFQAWLAAQYAAGKPVIVLYPLAEETTEQTTAQHLVTHEGANTVDSVANVGPLEAKVEYYASESTTPPLLGMMGPTEPQDEPESSEPEESEESEEI